MKEDKWQAASDKWQVTVSDSLLVTRHWSLVTSLAAAVLFTLSAGSTCQAAETVPPTIQSVSPLPGSTVSSLSQITVTFSEPVVGEQAADLIINNEFPAVTLTSTGAVVTFGFSQPAPGTVLVSFDPDTVITDQAGNPFDPLAPNASWSYTLADTVAPAVAAAAPAAGATVRTLTQVEVLFTESVSGVDVSDFRVNGQAATGLVAVAGSDAAPNTRYLFQFPQPLSGAVNISWTGGHGIQDLSPAANAFGGAGWSYTLNPAAAADVVLNEILADNLTSVVDEDNQKQDWIELHNRGAGAVNLLGWSLTDDLAQPGKWTFPAVTLNAGQYLLVFASGKDRKTTAANATNHTNFRLSISGGYLGLYGPESPRVAVSELGPTPGADYPEQRADKSYGRTSGGGLAYFSTPTPRATNNVASAVSGFAQPPHASSKSGLFNQPFNLVLSTETPGAQIRYTLDGKPPTDASPLYTGPIPVAGTSNKAVVIVRAAAFKAGSLQSLVTSHTYIFPEHVLTQPTNPAGFPLIWDSPCTLGLNCFDINPADYEMDPQVLNNPTNDYRNLALQGLSSLPSVSIMTDVNLLFGAAEGVYVRREPFLRKPVSAEFILPDGSEGFQIDCGLEMQGQTSPDDSSTGGSKWKSLKLGLRLFFQGEFGATKLHYKVFEDSPVDSFDTLLLAAGHNNYWNYNNNDTQRTRSLYVRDQYVADLQNLTGGRSHHGRFVHLYLNGLYWGLYFIHERPDASFNASYYGGEKEDYDVFKHDSSDVVDGSTASYTTMWGVINAGLANNANYEQLQQYLDVPGLIDYLLVNFWANNTDWDHKNLYASHRKGGVWRFHAWDSEHTMADSDFTLLSDNNGSNPTAILTRLLANSEFRVLLGDRVHRHFFNGGIFYTDSVNPIYNAAFPERNRPAAVFMKMLQDIDTAIVCESARWGDVGPGREINPHTRNVSFYEERDVVMGYRATFGAHSSFNFSTRSSGLLTQFRTRGWYPNVVAPSFNQHGGRVAAGFNLTMTAPAGTIYYTTNGADPRLYGSGAISPHARVYSAPVSVNSSLLVKARALVSTNWSALNEATFMVAELISPLRITELMYNPIGGDAFEFIELENAGGVMLDLTGFYFDGISFAFSPGSTLAPGARIVLASSANPGAFAARYPGVSVFGYFGGQLNNGGERITILRTLPGGGATTILSLDYDDQNGWPTAADGGGYSLELIDLNGDPDNPANWRASAAQNGTPGLMNSPLPTSDVVLNEVMAENLTAVTNGSTYPDWVELYNAGGGGVNLTDWSLTDDANPRKFVFPPGTSIAAGGYLVIWCDTNSAAPGLHTGFALGRKGENVFLYNASTGRVDAIAFGLQLPDLSIGRVNGSSTAGWQLTLPTPGALNMAVSVAAQTNLVVNEWLANAIPGGEDWIELYNRSGSQPVALGGIHLGVSNALFQVRSLSFIAPGGFVQLLADELPGPDHLDFKLPAGGGRIVLYDNAGIEVNRATYGAQAEGVSQGRLPNGATNVVSFAGSVSPEASNYLLSYSGPFLNEVLARNETALSPWGTYADWIEIRNTNASASSLAGMSLSDSPAQPGRWAFPAGATIPANGYLVVWCDSSRPASTVWGADMNTAFSLSGESDGVYLFSSAGQMLDSVEYGFQVTDMPIGRSGSQWRLLAGPTPGAPNAAPATTGSAASLRINEWLANSENGEDWFEVFNLDTQPVELSGLFVTDDLSIPGQMLFQVPPLSFIGGRDFAKFEADGNPGSGRHHVNFNLNAQGEAIRILAGGLGVIDTVYFGSQLPGASEGRLPDGAAGIVVFPETPTPGESNYRPLPNAVINEALTHADPPLEDAIELYNPSSVGVDLSGWYLSNSGRNFKKYRIPNGTTLTGGGYLVFYENQFNSTNASTPFTLSSAHGDDVWLAEADLAGNLSGYRAKASFGAAFNSVSFGRHLTCSGADFTAMSQRTFGVDTPVSVAEFRMSKGLPNAYPRMSPVVINEIMYHPPSVDGTNDNDLDEFLELHNPTGASVSLFDSSHHTNTWQLRNAVEFVFPTNVSLTAGGYLLVVNFNPAVAPLQLAAFRSRYGVPTNVNILGPYDGKLDNGGESVELYGPDQPESGNGFVPYVLMDRVVYNDTTPWPTNADGGGPSLQRLSALDHGNDAVNWAGANPTAGAPDAAQPALPPLIAAQPVSRAATVGNDVSFHVAACGSRPFTFQWQFNDANIGGATGAAHTISNVQAAHAGNYRVRVSNSAGAVTSVVAVLTIMAPPSITSQPQNVRTNEGNMATFTVAASGTGPLSYQWRFNAVNIPGATSAALILNNIRAADNGDYSVVVSNPAGSVASAAARLTVTEGLRIIAHPQNQSTGPGSNVTFMVSAVGTGPLSYQWTFNGTNINGAIASTLMLMSVQLSNHGTYRVLVTDENGSVFSQPATLTVRVLPSVLAHPQSRTVIVGSNVTLSALGSGTPPLGYRWRRGGLFYAFGEDLTSITLTNVQLTNGNTYNVIVTNSLNTTGVPTTNAHLVVVAAPTNQVANIGGNATFIAAAGGGSGAVRFQWQFGGTNLPNATNATLSLTNVQFAQAGAYTFMVTNTFGTPASYLATLTVMGSVLSQPQILSNGQFQMLLQGIANRSYDIEISTNLIDWSRLTTVNYTSGQMPVVDSTAAGAAQRFYRAKLLP